MCCLVCFFSIAISEDPEQSDIFFSGYTPSLQMHPSEGIKKIASTYTLLDANHYQQTVRNTRLKVKQLLHSLQPYRNQSTNEQVAFLTQQLSNIPYFYTGAMGEGDWQPTSDVYHSGAVIIKQDPVYRLDGLDCQTFVQMVMALLYSKNASQFDKNILKISYGAARNSSSDIVHYYNRNSFIDGDWNPINQHNGWLTDITSRGILAPFASTISAIIYSSKLTFIQTTKSCSEYTHTIRRKCPRHAIPFHKRIFSIKIPTFQSRKYFNFLPSEKHTRRATTQRRLST